MAALEQNPQSRRTRYTRAGRTWLVLGILAYALLAGCGRSSLVAQKGTIALSAATATSMPTATPMLVPQPTIALPAPITPSSWATYTNSTYHYTIQYLANWVTPQGVSPTAASVAVFNYDPRKISGVSDQYLPPPPLMKIEVDAAPNPSRQSASDFYATNEQNDPAAPPPSTRTTQHVTVAGRAALEVAQEPYGSMQYVAITYYVPDGTTMLISTQFEVQNGQPSDVFAHMIASLTLTS